MEFLGKLTLVCMFGMLVTSSYGCGRSAFTMPTLRTNPPPPVKLSEFAKVEIRPMTILPIVAEEEDPDLVSRIAQKLTDNVNEGTSAFVTAWNNDTQRPRTKGTLVIQPVIKQLKWVTRGERIWAGSMYGNSAIEVGLTMSEKSTGSVVHEAMIFTKAHAMGGAYGSQEDAMLRDISSKVINYIIQNYETATGGPTGVP